MLESLILHSAIATGGRVNNIGQLYMSWVWRNGKSVNDSRGLRRAQSVAGFDGPKILSSIRNFITEVNGLFAVAGATSGQKMYRFGDFGGGRANGSFEITAAVGANGSPGAKVNG